MSDLLRDFRVYLEEEAGLPIQNMYFNAALLLQDLCDFMGISQANQTKILGPTQATFLRDFIEQRMPLKGRIH